MKAIMYGAGNIGRGFIGQKFYLSGYETVFIDVNMAVVDAINQAHEYPVYVTGKHEYVEQPVKNVRAVDGRDNDAVVREIASCDIMATALGVNVIKFVAPLIGQAIEKRFAEGGRPLNILICENMIGSNVYCTIWFRRIFPMPAGITLKIKLVSFAFLSDGWFPPRRQSWRKRTHWPCA